MSRNTLESLKWIKDDIEQAAREIYYAMSLMQSSHPSKANLNLALKLLGVNHPYDVGLSLSVLRERDDSEKSHS